MNPCALLLLIVASTPFEVTFRSGLVALQQGDLKTAQTSLEAASKLEPRNGRVWVALSQTYWKLHKEKDAEAAADKASAFSPDDPIVSQSLLTYYSETQQPLKAARAAAKLPDKEKAAALYFEASQPLLQQQKYSEAAAVLQEAARQFPANAQIALALGVADYGLRRFDDAADAFLHTIDLSPDIEQPYLFLGRFLDQIPSRLPQVTERFVNYEAIHPTSAAFLLHAKALDAQSLDPDAALRLIDKSLAIDSTDASAHFERGAILDRLKRFAEATAEFEKAAAIAPDDPATHYRLARDYDRLGKHQAAQSERDKHAKLVKAPDNMPQDNL
jgi:tetratricopeptide (TPR) repeat protein